MRAILNPVTQKLLVNALDNARLSLKTVQRNLEAKVAAVSQLQAERNKLEEEIAQLETDLSDFDPGRATDVSIEGNKLLVITPDDYSPFDKLIDDNPSESQL